MASDLDETAKILGLKVAKPKSMAAKEPVPVDPNSDAYSILGLKPTERKKAGPTSRQPTMENLGPQQPYIEGLTEQVFSGMPIVGPLIEKGGAALMAASPFPNRRRKGMESFGDRYDDAMEELRNKNKVFSSQNPVASTAANVFGAGAVTLPIMMTGPGAVAFGNVGPSVVGRGLVGGTTGMTIGGVDAALRDENVAGGGAIGAATGVAGPAVAATARGVSSHFANKMAPRIGPLAGQPAANVNLLAGALEGETPGSISEARRRMGPSGMFADTNVGTTNLAGGLADTPGPHQGPLREAYIERMRGQRDRMEKTLDTNIVARVDMEKLKQHITEDQKAAASPLYQQWESMRVEPTDEIKALMPRLRKAGAFKRAMELADVTGDPVTRKFFTGGNTKDFPTTQTWNYVKQGLDRQIDAAYSGGDKTMARALIGLKGEMLEQIEKTNAGKVWSKARKEFATRAEWLDQIEAGRDTFMGGRSGITRDELREELKHLSRPELMARLQGVRATIDDAMGETVRGDGSMRAKLLAPNNQEKLRLLLGDKRADKIIDALKSEEFLAGQHTNVIGNLQTGASGEMRKARRENMMMQATPEWGFDLQKPGSWLPPSWREAIRPGNVIGAYRAEKHQKSLNKLADVMMTPEPQMDDLVLAIRNEAARRSAAAARGGRAGNLMSGAIAGPLAPSVREKFGR